MMEAYKSVHHRKFKFLCSKVKVLTYLKFNMGLFADSYVSPNITVGIVFMAKEKCITAHQDIS